MLLHIIARGRIARSAEGELVDRYVKRLSWPIKLTELPDVGGKMPAASVTPARTVLLDESGDMLTSQQFADLIGRWRDDGVREVRFCVGAADGFTADERAGADRSIAFGRATWPHLLARALLAEQLYRATAILAGHPYHREGMR